ncbi:conserved hypothetical protein [Paraburkholderia ribeironis]|uniref:Uncharacterized protein n=1 Tax=Paraburkholderia ribeironis TaxID=1247936 RepID=A0A1N7SAM8_9BURK|nr:hypothetical protein [Paraburkholderia ribeironis]SIT44048.1 conserved hypothetical protein [Paraburkholderia ribeironis]
MSITHTASYLTRYRIGFAAQIQNNEVVAVRMHLYEMHSHTVGPFLNMRQIVDDLAGRVHRPIVVVQRHLYSHWHPAAFTAPHNDNSTAEYGYPAFHLFRMDGWPPRATARA